MGIRALFGTIIDLLYDDDLFASLAALEDDSNLCDSPLKRGQETKQNYVLFRACRLEERLRTYRTIGKRRE